MGGRGGGMCGGSGVYVGGQGGVHVIAASVS